ncbi:M24 family metallopeptidase [Pelodictyon luteolum]|uniref:Aminopeptidase P n=1 Tax=Chlorobium luteolum (strain DSM 273 / BCRC 81028 / 2530) TaxID=319225 RepID=Q3B2H4_CHLL3|nr:aminopeptidase P family protein [Pelodictyon luteolum]ABB24457.1 aminopeptidase P [Pelodictyon luteolum DSM 273]
MGMSGIEDFREAALAAVRSAMEERRLGGFIITDLSTIRWLTGFSGSSARLLVTPSVCRLFTDFRYREQAEREVAVAETVVVQEGVAAELASGRHPLKGTVALQSDTVLWQDAKRFMEALANRCSLEPLAGFFNEFRMVKNPVELNLMQNAADISGKVLDAVVPMISERVSECDIATEISCLHRKFGGEKDSFDPIVAGGARSAMPHARPTGEQFREGALVVIDMGCMAGGYASDQTRTVALGRVPDEARRVYDIVREAQQLGIRSARCGMKARELDAVVRSFIAGHGYGEAFGHGLGHGIGLEVHEEPRISLKGEAVLQEGMVFTIEPGIYLEGRFGVRIEDTVVMEAGGARPLQRFTKELIEL